MKHIVILSVLIAVVVMGCKSTPDTESVYPTSTPKAGNALSVAVSPLKAQGVAPEMAATLSDVLCTQISGLARYKDVLCASDLAAILQSNETAALIGTCESDDCFSALGSAAKRQFVVGGTIGLVEENLVINLSLVDTVNQMAIQRSTIQVAKDGDLIAAVKEGALELSK